MHERRGDDTRAEQFTRRGHNVERSGGHLAKHRQRLNDGDECIELLINIRGEGRMTVAPSRISRRVAGRVTEESARRLQIPLAQLLDPPQRAVGLGSTGPRPSRA
jgi:hypothetical protein